MYVMSLPSSAKAALQQAALIIARTPEAKKAVAAAAAAPPPPPPMTAEEAVRQAEAEGLTLLKADNISGFKGVGFTSGSKKAKPYQAKVQRGGMTVYLGCFATAEEAALTFARSPEAQAAVMAAAAAPPAPPPMPAEEAVRQAAEEGLTLLKTDNAAGYKGVSFASQPNLAKPYRATVWRGGKTVSLGCFATAEEAALSFARSPDAQAAVVAAAAAPPAPPLPTAEEALRQAEVEGVTLLRSDISSSGYQGVSCRSGGSKPYQAIVRRGGKKVHLGYFVTAEAAALTFARSSAAHAASSRKRKAEPEEEQEDAEDDDVEVVVLDAYELFE